VGQKGVESAKATSELRGLDVLKVKLNNFSWKRFVLFTDTGTLVKARVQTQGPTRFIKLD